MTSGQQLSARPMEVSQSITAKSASNLALAFILLPKEKREQMAALYAFCREVDDIADNDSTPLPERRLALQHWREDLQRAYQSQPCRLPVNRELSGVIQARKLPYELFDELLRGVEMDLDVHAYETFDELELYCYRVASVVGLLSIEIFQYQDPRCRDYAIFLGKALQLTNILRDVRNDAERGRIYLPREEMTRCGVAERDILENIFSERYFNLAESIAARARDFYRKAREALPAVDRKSMATAELMGSVYWRLLQKLERRRFNVFQYELTRLTKLQKLFLIFRTGYRAWRGTMAPNYGAA